MCNLIAELQVKAYQQGYRPGLNGLTWLAGDWGVELLPEYCRGSAEGRAARESDTQS